MAGLDAASLKRAKRYRIGAIRGYGNAIVPQCADTRAGAGMTPAERTPR
jgi:hypothetical protein